MNDIRICTLYSGSGGNSTYVKIGECEILIDAGKCARALCSALSEIGSDLSRISAIFITHEHTDHVSALEVISKKYAIPIHITDKSAEKFDRTPEAFIHKNIVRHKEIEFSVVLDSVTVTAFHTPHDSMMSVGYKIETNRDTSPRRIAVATDIGYVSENVRKNLLGCEAIVLESNHDEQMLERGPYPYDLKMRILSKGGHLSNKDSAALAAELVDHGAKAFLLAHLSEENNTPELAFDEFYSAIASDDVAIAVAAADIPTELKLKKETPC